MNMVSIEYVLNCSVIERLRENSVESGLSPDLYVASWVYNHLDMSQDEIHRAIEDCAGRDFADEVLIALNDIIASSLEDELEEDYSDLIEELELGDLVEEEEW